MRFALLAVVLASLSMSIGCSDDPSDPIDPAADGAPADAVSGPDAAADASAVPDAVVDAADATAVPDAAADAARVADAAADAAPVPDAAVDAAPDARPAPDAAPDAPVVPDAALAAPDAAAPDAAAPDAAPIGPAPAPDAAPPDAGPPACTGLPWHVEADPDLPPASTSARIEDGNLVLVSHGTHPGLDCHAHQKPCLDVKAYQRVLRGDFDVSVDVDGVDGAAYEEGVYFFVRPSGANVIGQIITSIIGYDVSPLALSVLVSAPGDVSITRTFATTTRSTLRVRRSNGVVTFSSAAADRILERTTTAFPTMDMVVGVGIMGGAPDRPVTGRVARFNVQGGGGDVLADEFDCPAVLH